MRGAEETAREAYRVYDERDAEVSATK